VELVEEVDAAVMRAAEAPRSFPMLEDAPGVRRVLLSRFPYSIVFTETDDGSIHVVAIAHMKQRPLFWRRRLR
jgi:plasmid stabilization system protein ParE